MLRNLTTSEILYTNSTHKLIETKVLIKLRSKRFQYILSGFVYKQNVINITINFIR